MGGCGCRWAGDAMGEVAGASYDCVCVRLVRQWARCCPSGVQKSGGGQGVRLDAARRSAWADVRSADDGR